MKLLLNLGKEYDVIVIGTGPAGIASSIFSKLYNLKVLHIGKVYGGQLTKAKEVANFPGFGITTGKEIIDKFRKHEEELNIEIEEDEVVDILKEGNKFTVLTKKNKRYESKAVILAIGLLRKSKFDKYVGKGLSYCPSCDAYLFKNKKVIAIVNDEEGVDELSILYSNCKEVIVVSENEKVLDKIKGKKIKGSLKEIIGNEKVEKAIINDKEIEIDGIFILDKVPSSLLIEKLNIELEGNFIKVDKEMKTNVEGVFAAGDVTNASKLKQIVTSLSQGAIAALSSLLYIKSKFK